MKLRNYQIRFLRNILELFSSGVQGVIGDMPTGSGKTVCIARLCQIFSAKRISTLIIVHRDELVEQTSRKLASMNVEHGIVASKTFNPNPKARVQICMVQTIVRRLDRIGRNFGLLIVDEAHLGAAASYQKIIDKWPEALRLGLSATPYRTDKKGLAAIGTHIVKGPRVRELIDNGSLVPFRTIGIDVENLSGLKIVNGEYDRESQSKLLDRPAIVGKVYEHFDFYAKGRSALVFAASRKHSISLYKEFRSHGIKAYHIDGETPSDVRKKAIEYLNRGKIQVLCNYGCLTEGFDSTIVSAIVVARKTASTSLWKQICGRGLRTHEGKVDCIIIDHGGNYIEHGNVDYEPEYSVFGSKKRKSRTVICKVCKNCAVVMDISCSKCPECGYSYESEGRADKEVKESDGTLVEITSTEPLVKRTRESIFLERIAVKTKIDNFLNEMGV